MLIDKSEVVIRTHNSVKTTTYTDVLATWFLLRVNESANLCTKTIESNLTIDELLGTGSNPTYNNNLIIGPRRCGKTMAIINMLMHMAPEVLANSICFSLKNDMDYKHRFPTMRVHKEFSKNVLIDYMANNHDQGAIIFDDHVHDNKWSTVIMNDIVMNRKFHKKFVLMADQCSSLHPAIRSNIDNVIVFGDPCVTYRKKLYDHYGSFINFAEFDNKYAELTLGTAMVIDNSRRTIGSITFSNVFSE
jgi:hypothetical protein